MSNLPNGNVDGRPYRVCQDNGWVVRAKDGTNAYEPGWRWNTRAAARSFKAECQLFGHIPASLPTPSQSEA